MSHVPSTPERRCRIWDSCPHWREHPKLGRDTCMGEWGRTCLIWKELEIIGPTYRTISFKMSLTDWRRDES
jgi:hypothetical protein